MGPPPFLLEQVTKAHHTLVFYHFLLTCNIIIASLVELSHVKLQADDCKHEDGHK